MMTRVLTGAFALLIVATLTIPPVFAQPNNGPVTANIVTVLASEDAGEIDSELAGMAALRRAPFNSFRSMRVLDRSQVSLRVRQPEEITLPNGRRMRIRLQQIMPDGRYRVRVSIKREQGNNYLPLLQVVASPGDPFFVAGQSHEGGTLVLGISVGEAPSS